MPRNLFGAVFGVFLLSWSAGWTSPALANTPSATTPTVVATIKPLASIAASIMAGIAKPVQMIPATVSPHAYALKPSDAEALQSADVVLAVGASLEKFLDRSVKILAADAVVIRASDLKGITLLPWRHDGVWAAQGDADDGGHGHTDGAINPHLWLDPANVKIIARRLADTLMRLDPAHAEIYRRNDAAFVRELDALDREIAAKLAPVEGKPFIVMHDAYAYLDVRYGLNARGSIALDPDHPPSARRIRELRHLIENRGAVCVFAEPQFPSRIIATLSEGTALRAGTLDPIGVAAPAGPGAYAAMMRSNADALVRCLGSGN